MKLLGLEGVKASDILDVIEGYLGEGYGIADTKLKGITCSTHVYIGLSEIAGCI